MENIQLIEMIQQKKLKLLSQNKKIGELYSLIFNGIKKQNISKNHKKLRKSNSCVDLDQTFVVQNI